MKIEDLNPEDRRDLDDYIKALKKPDKFHRGPVENRTMFCDKLNKRVVFDSEGEMRRWNELVLLERAGIIKDLKRQVTFLLVHDKTAKFKLSYRADFTYLEEVTSPKFGNIWTLVVEDFKGLITDAYKQKKRLMMTVHGIVIRETRYRS